VTDEGVEKNRFSGFPENACGFSVKSRIPAIFDRCFPPRGAVPLRGSWTLLFLEVSMRHQTHIEAVVEIMVYSKFGALAQLFVIDALAKFSEKAADAPPGEIGGAGFIDPLAWRGVAREIQGKLKRHLNDASRKRRRRNDPRCS
jgi:hypothetical protein